MSDQPTADEAEWGKGVWVYCEAHRNPHRTGWCTVGVRSKQKLDATTEAEAVEECRRKSLHLWKP